MNDPCKKYAALLDAFLDGELPLEQMEQVRRHLDTCPPCRDYVDACLALRAVMPQVEDTPVPEDFTQNVMAAVAAHPRKTRRWTPARRRAAMAAIAACLAAAMFLTNYQDWIAPFTGGGAADAAADAALFREANPEEEDAAAQDPSQEEKTEKTPQQYQYYAVTQDTADPAGDADAYVEGENVVFSFTVFLTREEAGDALAGYTGKPYSTKDDPETVIGTGYAMTVEEAEHILYDVLDYPLGPMLNDQRTTELGCIVVTEEEVSSSGN